MPPALPPVPHLSPEDFRRLGHRAVDWIADYWERVESLPVRSPLAPGEVAARLPAHPPEAGLGGAQGWEAVFRDLEDVVLPGLTHWQSPSFFAYFPSNASGPAVLGELLSAGLGVQGMLWSTSPAATEVETRVLDWLAELTGLPQAFRSTSAGGGGVIQGTASEAALVAMVAARARVRSCTAGSAPLVAYASTQAHSSVLKAALLCGVAGSVDDRVHLRLVDTDARHALRPEVLEGLLAQDVAAGRQPFFVCATLGTTSSGAFDPLVPLGEVLRRAGFAQAGGWLHVDAAWAGSAAVCPELRGGMEGLEAADSYAFNPHKWLLTNFDCDAFFTRDRQALVAALSVTPEYLRNAPSEAGAVVDYRDWQVPLGRRFRALKLWLVLRHYGAEGLRAHIRHHVQLGALFESLVQADARFELAAPRSLSLVCFRLAPHPGEAPADTDARNRALLERVNATGRAFLSHTVLPAPSRYVLRMAIGATHTAERHVRAAWELLGAQV